MIQPLFEHRQTLAGFETRVLELEGEGAPVVMFHLRKGPSGVPTSKAALPGAKALLHGAKAVRRGLCDGD